MERVIRIDKYYGSLSGMLRKYDNIAKQGSFGANTIEEYEEWKNKTRLMLAKLIGLDRMESCPLNPVIEETVALENGITREKVIIQVEPETYMPMYLLIPPKTDPAEQLTCFIAPPGHQGAGKYSVAGCYEIPAVKDMIDYYNYDYGMQLAKLGYVAICPDCRGFGERRDEDLQTEDEKAFLNSTCYQLAHMAEPLGQTVVGMCTWDLMRLIDYIYDRKEWRTDTLGCLGFSGGGMQTLWLSALDDRIRQVVISGYLYGYRDSLLLLNGNCSCNYVPHLWEHLDMGDIGALIAPRPLMIQSCREDHLNGPRGLSNVTEQLDILKRAYCLYGKEELVVHDIHDGGHRWHGDHLKEILGHFKNFL